MAEAKPKDPRLKRQLSLCQHYKDTFETKSGRIILHDLMKQAGMLSTSHVPGDSHSTSFNEGTRQSCLYILQQLNTSEQELIKLIEGGKHAERDLFDNNGDVTGG
jgi:hypothetical protein